MPTQTPHPITTSTRASPPSSVGGLTVLVPAFCTCRGPGGSKTALVQLFKLRVKKFSKKGQICSEVYPSIWGFPCSSVSKKICLTSQDRIWRMACILPASELGGKASLAEVPIPFPVGSVSGDWKTHCLQCRRPRFNPWVGKSPWRRKWQSTPVSLPRKI